MDTKRPEIRERLLRTNLLRYVNMRTQTSLIFLSCCLFFLSQLPAQNQNVQANIRDWNLISTDNFDIYYPDLHQGGALITARFAERARFELGVLFDYKPESRYTIIYAADAQTLLASNLTFVKKDHNPGVFHLPDRHGIVIHPETSRDLYVSVKREVASLILKDFTYGTKLGTTFQSQLLLYDAPWFQQGLSEFVASGWTYEDQMIINSIPVDDLMELALEGDKPLNRLVRKSIWHFITHEYGEQKISEIIYLVNISHSIESGIISVLGVNLNTLTARWKEFLIVRAEAQMKNRVNVQEISSAINIPIEDGENLIAYSYHAGQRQIAMYLVRGEKHTIELYDLSTKKRTPTSVKFRAGRQDAETFAIHASMAWDPNGQTLVSTIWKNKSYELVYLDSETGTHTSVALPSKISRVQHINWSSDGSQLLLSALNSLSGTYDLYLLPREGAELSPLTEDSFDNLDPSWGPDNQTLYFSSNRDSLGIAVEGQQLNGYQTNFDLYRLTLQNGNPSSITRITHTPSLSERSPNWTMENSLTYRSDAVGIVNLEELTEPQEKGFPTVAHISDLSIGLQAFQQAEDIIAMTVPVNGYPQLYLVPLESLRSPYPPSPTLLRLQYEVVFETQQESLRRKKELEALEAEQASIDALEIEELEQDQDSRTPETEVEAEEKEEKPKARYYIFDEEEDDYEAPPSNPIVETEDQFLPEDRIISTVFGKQAPPELKDIRVGGSQTARSPWKVSSIGFGLQYDPIAKLGPEFTLQAVDLFGNHKIDFRTWPSINLRNSETVIKYTYQKRKIDFFIEAGHRARRIRQTGVVQSDSLIFRFDRTYADIGIIYPFLPYFESSLRVGFYRTDRKDQQLLRATLQNALDHLVHAKVDFTLDRVRETNGYQYKGVYGQAGFESFYSLAQKGIAFNRARLELKHYHKLSGPIVLATRLASSISAPKSLKQFYMGDTRRRLHRPIIFQNRERNTRVQNQVTDTSLHAIHFLEFVAPVRGFLPNTRNGSRYVAANLEVRIPLTRMAKHSLPANPLYNLEIIPFIDAGTAWEDGNPFSQKKPTDTHYIASGPITIKLQTLKSPFLIGFGSGLRTNVLGWSARLDLAWGMEDYSIQRPIFTTSLAKNF
ncbi:MAG: hypothetical protein AAF587_41135 [Bacteroidota bacterium]